MKILYGIQLTGNGHISRSNVIINRLKNMGHQIDVVTSGSGSNLLIENIKYNFKGLTLQYTNGRINWIKTVLKSKPLQLIRDIRLDVSEYDLIISDFEPISAWSSKISGVKSISICNQNSIIIGNKKWNIFKLFIKWFAKCDHLIGFDYMCSENIFQPICDIESEMVSDGLFYLVYLPYIDNSNLSKILKGAKFKVYTNQNISNVDNIEFKKISKDDFRYDLLNCRGVITNSGFSTTSEALILNKKLWSIPISGQYEQEINAKNLSNIGVYTNHLNKDNLSFWLSSTKIVKYDWTNPIDFVIEKIFKIYGED